MKSKKRATGLTGRQIEHLLWGWSLGAGRENKLPFESDDARREAWFANKDYILSLRGVEHVPGVFGCVPLKKGQVPQAMKDYEGRQSKVAERSKYLND